MVLQASGDCLSAREDVLKSSEGEGPIMLSINATQSYTVISFLYSTCSTRYKLIFNKKKKEKRKKKGPVRGSDGLRTRTGPFWTEPTVRFKVHQDL